MLFKLFACVLKQVPIFSSGLGECCDAVLLRSSRNVLWTKKLSPDFPSTQGYVDF